MRIRDEEGGEEQKGEEDGVKGSSDMMSLKILRVSYGHEIEQKSQPQLLFRQSSREIRDDITRKNFLLYRKASGWDNS